MLMKPDRKKMASIIVAKMGAAPAEAHEAPTNAAGDETNTEMDGPAMAADDVFHALETKDKAAFIDAMKSMVSMCMDADEGSEEEPAE